MNRLDVGCFIGFIDHLGASSVPAVLEHIVEDIDSVVLVLDNGYRQVISKFCYRQLEYNKNNLVDDFIIFASENRNDVLYWMEGYKASCKILKEFIHI